MNIKLLLKMICMYSKVLLVRPLIKTNLDQSVTKTSQIWFQTAFFTVFGF